MLPRHRRVLALSSVLVLLAAAAWAGDAVIGNLNDPTHVLPDYVTGQESFAYLVYPPEQASCPEGGFTMETIRMWLGFTLDDVPVTFQARGRLLEATLDPFTGQWVPGPVICETAVFEVTVTDDGLFELVLPFLPGDCGPLLLDAHYFLAVDLLTPLVADLPLDSQPEAGVAYQNTGQGWVDMDGLKRADSGKIIIWGDIVCSAPPVGNARDTWGAVKGLYR